MSRTSSFISLFRRVGPLLLNHARCPSSIRDRNGADARSAKAWERLHDGRDRARLSLSRLTHLLQSQIVNPPYKTSIFGIREMLVRHDITDLLPRILLSALLALVLLGCAIATQPT